MFVRTKRDIVTRTINETNGTRSTKTTPTRYPRGNIQDTIMETHRTISKSIIDKVELIYVEAPADNKKPTNNAATQTEPEAESTSQASQTTNQMYNNKQQCISITTRIKQQTFVIQG